MYVLYVQMSEDEKHVCKERGTQPEPYTACRSLLTDLSMDNDDSVHIPYCPILVLVGKVSKKLQFKLGIDLHV